MRVSTVAKVTKDMVWKYCIIHPLKNRLCELLFINRKKQAAVAANMVIVVECLVPELVYL